MSARRPGFVRRRWEQLKTLWRRALEENATPGKFAWGVAIGAFVSAGPFYGVRTVSGVFLGWLLKLNKLTTTLSTHLLSGPLAFLAIAWEIKLGCAILHRPMPTLAHEVVAAIDQARSLFVAWLVGCAIVAPPFAAISGAIAYPIAKRWKARRANAAATSGTDAAP